jgi:hypothetical protein
LSRRLGIWITLLTLPACTTLRWGATPHRRNDALGTHLKMGSQTGITLNDPHYAGEAVFEYGGISKGFLLAGRTFAIVRLHGGTPDDGNDDNDGIGAGFGQLVLGGTNISDRIDVHGGVGYVFSGWTGPRAMIGTTLWPVATDAGGGYGVNVELDFYRGSASNATREYTFNHLALTVGLELDLGAASFGL